MTATRPNLRFDSAPHLPVLTFNFEQLKAWATGLTERYDNLVVTEDAVVEVKKDMAELNKAKRAVDDARKEAVKRISEPIRTFEGQIKEVCGIFDTAYAKLGVQVKKFEEAQREEKRKMVEAIIEELGMQNVALLPPGFRAADIPVQAKWLNKTTSFKSIREDVAAIIQRHVDDLKQKKALEQARQDRAATIENHVKTLNQRDGYDISVSFFMGESFLDASTPLADVLKRVDNYFILETQKRERQAAKNAAPAMTSASTGAAVKSTPQPQNAGQSSADSLGKAEAPAKTRAMSIVLEYEENKEAQINACLDNLKSLCVSFGARHR